jgi:FtsH-binding integral membrane protein
VTPPSAPATHDPARARKFRQAAFVYLHVAILYEAAAIAMWRHGMLDPGRMVGPAWVWLVAGALLAGAIFFGLLRWQNVVFARVIWAVHAMRLPSLISSAFIATGEGGMSHAFYITAIVVVVINLWMLARAAWDL